MITLLVLVIFSAIFVLFTEELLGVLKKYYDIYWIRVTVPLIVMSWMWIWNDETIPVMLEWLQDQLNFVLNQPARLLPHALQWIIQGLILFILASVPAWLLHWKFSQDILTSARAEIVSIVYVFSWVLLTVVLLA
jgi:hypothetical protein